MALGRLGRRGILGIVVVLLAAAGVGTWLWTRPSDAQAAQTITATASTGTFQDTVSATGTLAPLKQADLDFGVTGRVTAVKVAAGDTVEKGEVLARLDRTSLEAAVTSADAQLDAAQAQYDDDVDADASSTQLASDTASITAAESTLSQARDDRDAATLTATMTGTVVSVDVAVGDQVSGSSSSSSGSTSTGTTSGSAGGSGAATGTTAAGGTGADSTTSTTSSSASQVVIVSPRLFQVEADVAADDVTSVKKGMQAQVTPSGASEAVYGTVSDVGLVATVSSSGAATFPVTVTLTGAQSTLYAGTSTTVSIITKQVDDVLSVPTAALHTSGSTTYVEKLVDGTKTRTTVKTGETYGTATQVTSGLQSGDEVVVTTVRLPTGSGGNRSGESGLPGGGEGGFPGGAGGGGPPDGGGGGNQGGNQGGQPGGAGGNP